MNAKPGQRLGWHIPAAGGRPPASGAIARWGILALISVGVACISLVVLAVTCQGYPTRLVGVFAALVGLVCTLKWAVLRVSVAGKAVLAADGVRWSINKFGSRPGRYAFARDDLEAFSIGQGDQEYLHSSWDALRLHRTDGFVSLPIIIPPQVRTEDVRQFCHRTMGLAEVVCDQPAAPGTAGFDPAAHQAAFMQQCRDAGFYVENDGDIAEWVFEGPRSALTRLSEHIVEVAGLRAGPPGTQPPGRRLGPVLVGIDEEPWITQEGIFGPPEALRDLAGRIIEGLLPAEPGAGFEVFGWDAGREWTLRFVVRPEGYDPAAHCRYLG